MFGPNRGSELDVWGVFCDRLPTPAFREVPPRCCAPAWVCAARNAVSLRWLQRARPRTGVVPPPQPVLRCGAALVGFFGHLRKGTVEVRGGIPSSAGDFVDGTSCNGFQLAGRSSEGEDMVDDLGLRSIVVSTLLDDLGDLVQPNL